MGRPKGPTRDTKQLILDEALRLFATQGLKATTVKEIAEGVGIKDASLYNYFSGKQEIFNAVLEKERDYAYKTIEEHALSYPSQFALTGDGVQAFQDCILSVVELYFTDERLEQLRKLLTVTQFEYEEANALYQEMFIERPQVFVQDTLEGAVSEYVFKQCNLATTACSLQGAFFVLLAQGKLWNEARSRIISILRAFERSHS